ncbi:MAG: hypothetical protein GMKNLPBB_01678 [Myxococcota bacterium]|nr:hypothetical protein [Myxococcota bacterium]
MGLLKPKHTIAILLALLLGAAAGALAQEGQGGGKPSELSPLTEDDSYTLDPEDLENQVRDLRARAGQGGKHISTLEDLNYEYNLPRARISFKNDVGRDFLVDSITIYLDGMQVYPAKGQEIEKTPAGSTTLLFDRRVSPGNHRMDVFIIYRGNSGTFSYMEGYRVKLAETRTFYVRMRGATPILLRGYEREGLGVQTLDRPALEVELDTRFVANDPTFVGRAPNSLGKGAGVLVARPKVKAPPTAVAALPIPEIKAPAPKDISATPSALAAPTGTRLRIIHQNEMGKSFLLRDIRYTLNGQQIFRRDGARDAELAKAQRFEAGTFDIKPGVYQFGVNIVYAGAARGIFNYMEDMRFRADHSHPLTINEGETVELTVIGYEDGGVFTKQEDLPAVRVIANVVEGRAVAAATPGGPKVPGQAPAIPDTGTRIKIIHDNQMGSGFLLRQVRYVVDGQVIYNRDGEKDASLRTSKLFDAGTFPVKPGNHKLTVNLVYSGSARGIFDYMEDFRYRANKSENFSIKEGETIEIRVTGLEEGGIFTKPEDKPAVRIAMTSLGGGVAAAAPVPLPAAGAPKPAAAPVEPQSGSRPAAPAAASDTRARVIFLNQMTDSFLFKSIVVRLDGKPVLRRSRDKDASIASTDKIDLGFVDTSEGRHTFDVDVVYSGNGRGFFTYMDDMNFRAARQHDWVIGKGQTLTFNIIGYEESGALIRQEDRPQLRITLDRPASYFAPGAASQAAGGQVHVIHKNEMGDGYKLLTLIYRLNGKVVFSRDASKDPSAAGVREFDVGAIPVSPGPNVLKVTAVYAGNAKGFFTYMEDMRFRAEKTHEFNFIPGQDLKLTVKGVEEGGIFTRIEDRPGLQFETGE